jgi:hypothetical protein
MRGVVFAVTFALLANALPVLGDDAGKPAAIPEDALRQRWHAEMQRADAEAADYMLSIFAESIPTDQQLKHEVNFGPNQSKISIIIDKRLAQGLGSVPLGLEHPDPAASLVEALKQRAFEIRLTPDGDVFVQRCFSASGQLPFCTFSQSRKSSYADYVILGEWFVIPGDGCIHSRAGSWQRYGTPNDLPVVNCLNNGALKPVLQPLGQAPEETRT